MNEHLVISSKLILIFDINPESCIIVVFYRNFDNGRLNTETSFKLQRSALKNNMEAAV